MLPAKLQKCYQRTAPNIIVGDSHCTIGKSSKPHALLNEPLESPFSPPRVDLSILPVCERVFFH
jgi:hypothetical protein